MLLSKKDYKFANMVCWNQYELIKGTDDNHWSIVSRENSVFRAGESLYEYRVFRQVSKKTDKEFDDEKKYILEKRKKDIITIISKLDCNFSAENMETARKSVLAFCNEYGLFKSSAYKNYLQKYIYNIEDEDNLRFYAQQESMDLNEFIAITAKIRALAGAYSIHQKIQEQDPAYKYSKTDPVQVISTLLTLLISNHKAMNISDHNILMERLLDIDYLDDFFYRKYNGAYVNFFDDEKWALYMSDSDYLSALKPFHAESFVADKLHVFMKSIWNKIEQFRLGCDGSFSLFYPEKLFETDEEPGTDEEKDAEENESSAKLSRKHKERLYYEKFKNSFSKEQIQTLAELLGHTATCVLNYELQKIHTYTYFDSHEGFSFHSSYQCMSLYEQLIVEIAYMYVNKTILTKCGRHDYPVLFMPDHHSDKVYCDNRCKNIVSKRKYMYNRRRKKKKNEETPESK